MRTRAQAITDRQVKPPMIVNKQPQLSYKRPQESQINIQDTNYGKYMVCVMLILAISMKLSLWETRVSHSSGVTNGHVPTYQKGVCHPQHRLWEHSGRFASCSMSKEGSDDDYMPLTGSH